VLDGGVDFGSVDYHYIYQGWKDSEALDFYNLATSEFDSSRVWGSSRVRSLETRSPELITTIGCGRSVSHLFISTFGYPRGSMSWIQENSEAQSPGFG
jgi:hypothetical protein